MDTHRELDHIYATRAFRGGNNLTAALARMSCIDVLHPCHEKLRGTKSNQGRKDADGTSFLGHTFTDADLKCIIPVTVSLLEQGGFEDKGRQTPRNLYTKSVTDLPPTILDRNSLDAGKYLLFQYLASDDSLDQFTKTEAPPIADLSISASLKKKLEKAKGVTINRLKGVVGKQTPTEKEKMQNTKAKTVRKGQKLLTSITSEFNTCLTLINADGTKIDPKKAAGIRTAIKDVLLTAEKENIDN